MVGTFITETMGHPRTSIYFVSFSLIISYLGIIHTTSTTYDDLVTEHVGSMGNEMTSSLVEVDTNWTSDTTTDMTGPKAMTSVAQQTTNSFTTTGFTESSVTRTAHLTTTPVENTYTETESTNRPTTASSEKASVEVSDISTESTKEFTTNHTYSSVTVTSGTSTPRSNKGSTENGRISTGTREYTTWRTSSDLETTVTKLQEDGTISPRTELLAQHTGMSTGKEEGDTSTGPSSSSTSSTAPSSSTRVMSSSSTLTSTVVLNSSPPTNTPENKAARHHEVPFKLLVIGTVFIIMILCHQYC